jgi:hypothetical protein
MTTESRHRNGGLECAACGSLRVATVDAAGQPSCVRCRARELGYDDGQRDAAIELVEAAVAWAVEAGFAHPNDLARAVGEAIAAGEARRADLRPVPTHAETVEAGIALEQYDRLDGEG